MVYESVTADQSDKELKLWLYGKPMTWSAPTFSKRGGTYDKKWESKRDAYLLLKELDLKMISFPIKLEAEFYLPFPKALSKKRREASLGQYHSGHIDLTNLTKFIEDVLEKSEIIENDQLIVCHETAKKWDEIPRTEIKLVRIEE